MSANKGNYRKPEVIALTFLLLLNQLHSQQTFVQTKGVVTGGVGVSSVAQIVIQ